MNAIVGLWTNIQAQDETAVTRQIRWKQGAAIFQHGQGANSLRLPSTLGPGSEWDPGSPEPWVMELHESFRYASIRGWVAHPSRENSNLVETLRSSKLDAALYFVQVVLNRKLAEHSIQRPHLELVRPTQLSWQHRPLSLVGLLWLQFADSVANNRTFRKCAECKRWFEVSGSSIRSDKTYCSQTCRMRVYRSRQAEVRELYTLGATIEQLADRFDTDPNTIQRWLGIGRDH